MLWIFVVILFAAWIIGLLASYTMGGLIHVLLVVALIMVMLLIFRGPGEVLHKRGDGMQAKFRRP